MGERTGIEWCDATVDSTPEIAAAYLAALVDGEGCVSMYRVGKRQDIRRIITVAVCDRELIDTAGRCCRILGIPFRRSDKTPKNPKHRHIWKIDIGSRAGLETFAANVPLQHARKLSKLMAVVLSYQDENCTECGCPWNDRTPRCGRCTQRHKVRRRAERRAHHG